MIDNQERFILDLGSTDNAERWMFTICLKISKIFSKQVVKGGMDLRRLMRNLIKKLLESAIDFRL